MGSRIFVLYAYVRFAVAAQQPNEGGAELAIEYGVDDRIDGRRHVAQPQAHADHALRYRRPRAHGEHDVEDEERRPAQHEREEHDAENLRARARSGTKRPVLRNSAAAPPSG